MTPGASGEVPVDKPEPQLLNPVDGTDLYELLEVSPRASLAVIRAAYRALARSYHPDINPGDEAGPLIRRINAAYRVLGDPETRALYDLDRVRAHRAERIVRSHEAAHVPARRPTYTDFRPVASRQVFAEPGATRVNEVLIGVFLVLLAGIFLFTVLFMVLFATLDLGGQGNPGYIDPPEFAQG